MIDFTNVNINLSDIFIFEGIILGAIGAIWGIKKMIALGNADFDKKYDSGELIEDSDYGGWRDSQGKLYKYR